MDHRHLFYPSRCQSDPAMYEDLRGNEGAGGTAMNRRRVVITGLGPITCIGIGKEEFWKGIKAERSGISRITAFDTSAFHAHCGGEIAQWDPLAHFPPHRLKRLDRYAQFAVASAEMAL